MFSLLHFRLPWLSHIFLRLVCVILILRTLIRLFVFIMVLFFFIYIFYWYFLACGKRALLQVVSSSTRRMEEAQFKDFDGRSPIYCSYFIFATFSLLQMKMKFLIKTIRVVFIAVKAAAVAVAVAGNWSRSWNSFCCWCVIFNEGIYSWHFHFARKSLQHQQQHQKQQ